MLDVSWRVIETVKGRENGMIGVMVRVVFYLERKRMSDPVEMAMVTMPNR